MSTCQRPGCAGMVEPGGVHGYCLKHATDAVVERLSELSGRVDENTKYLDNVHQRLISIDERLANIERDLPATA